MFNADDFGRSDAVNRAVELAYRQGLLTSASLMVTGEAVERAFELARALPGLAVGLHLVLSDGRPALPASQVPHLVRRDGCFPSNPALVWIQYFFSAPARAEMAREMAAQFDRFAASGLPLVHVDGHQHVHVHPAVFRRLLPLCKQYGARGLRLPRDDFWQAMAYDRRNLGRKLVNAAVFALLCGWHARSVRQSARQGQGQQSGYRPAVAGKVFGTLQSGRMDEAYVLRVLASLRAGTAELYFHPGTEPEADPLGPNPTDLATLLSPALRQAVEAHGLKLATYATLAEEG